ncbi:MAG: MFS transporter [Trueperaceae bacterium]|nr:MFS transporter [Trueperaceae bacterium]
MRPARAFYFLHFAALAALMPYLSIYFASRGLTGVEIGILASLVPLMTMLGAPFWTEVADATGRHKAVLVAVIGVVVLAALALSLATHIVTLGIFTALLAFHLAPSMPLLDHAVLEALGDRAHAYGRQRVWGALGWAISAPAAGWVTATFGLPWAFFLFLAVMPWVAIAASRVTYAPVTAAGTRRIGGGLALVLRDARWIPFLVTGFAGGVGLAMVVSFLPLHLRDLGGSLTVIGVAMAVPAISEIPFMVFGGALLAAVGPRRLLIVAVATMALRLLLSGVITDYVSVAAVQILHGPSFAVLWIAGVSYARELAPRGSRAVAQGLFTAVTGGLGSFAGSILGGATYDAWGGAATFLVAAAFMALAAVLLAAWRPVPAVAQEATAKG